MSQKKQQAKPQFFKQKKVKSAIRWSLFFVFTALFIISLVWLTLKINVLLASDLVIDISPKEITRQSHIGNEETFSFTVTAQALPFCSTTCDYAFFNSGKNVLLERDTIQLPKENTVTANYTVQIQAVGKGQDIYKFEVTCRNDEAIFCLSTGIPKQSSALALVSYDLNEEQQLLKAKQQENLILLLDELQKTDSFIKSLSDFIVHIRDQVIVDSLLQKKAEHEDDFGSLHVQVNQYRTLWQQNSFLQLEQQFNVTLLSSLLILKSDIQKLTDQAHQLRDNHNENHLQAQELAQQSQLLHNLHAYQSYLGQDHEQTEQALQQLNETIHRWNTQSFADYTAIALQLNQTQKTTNLALEQYQETQNNVTLLANLLAAYQQDVRCMAANNSCTPINLSVLPFDPIQDVCAQFPPVNNVTLTTGQQATLDKIENNVQYQYVNQSLYSSSIELLFPENRSTPLVLNETIDAIPQLQEVEKFKDAICTSNATSLQIATSAVHANYTFIQSTLDTSLQEAAPVCCIFGNCKPCCISQECQQDQSTIPVIFLHGHAFNKASTPEFSLDAFTALQYRLEQEGYLNAGIITPRETLQDTPPGIWGLSGNPITVRATYYLDAVREENDYVIIPTNSESIDTYALRLRDVIASVKHRTGKQQVHIIAHSMGGLVARKYLQIFGDDEVATLIMVATPNNGVEGSSREFCPVFGEAKECADMQKGSLFLKKLNDQLDQPDSTQLYTLTGSGCDTGGVDGDGVVTVDSSTLDNAQNREIVGECKGLFAEPLHTQILNPDLYPQVFEEIKEILNEG